MEIAKSQDLLWAEIVKPGAERVESGRMIVHAETSGFNIIVVRSVCQPVEDSIKP